MATALSLTHIGSLMRGVRSVDEVGADERAASLAKRSIKKSSKLWALDLGKKRIGLAVSDELGLTAQGLPTLQRTNKKTDLAALRNIIRERGVTQIVMGNPLHMSGDAGRQGVDALVEQLMDLLAG